MELGKKLRKCSKVRVSRLDQNTDINTAMRNQTRQVESFKHLGS